jgi:hypothetical protein
VTTLQTPGWSARTRLASPVTPTPPGTASARPTGGRVDVSVHPRARPPPGHGPRPLPPRFVRIGRPGFPQRLRRHHPAERGQRRAARSLGFELVGVYRDVGFKLGRWHDVGWWALTLQELEQPGPPNAFSALPEAVRLH